MIPYVFISSTVDDLMYLRDAVRETILDIGYVPVMSDYGDIGYLPSSSAEESCYTTIKECQLVVLIIGKRYGSLSHNGLSITNNEFITARDHNIPVISLIDSEVLSFKKIYDANAVKGIEQEYPGMDMPYATFTFIDGIMKSKLNNGILPFGRASEAQQNLKKQIAHIVGDLLKNRYDPIKVQLKDILSEVKTVRHELLKDKGLEPVRYMRTIRILLDDGYRNYRNLIEKLENLDSAIFRILESKNFEEFLAKTKTILNLEEIGANSKQSMESIGDLIQFNHVDVGPEEYPYEGPKFMTWAILKPQTVVMNKATKEYFEECHKDVLSVTQNLSS